MGKDYFIMLPILFPILAGILLMCIPVFDKSRRIRLLFVGCTLVIHFVLCIVALCIQNAELILFHLTDALPVYFKIDNVSRLFSGLTSFVWLLSGFFAFSYMKHEHDEKRYFGFFLIVLGVLMGLDFSGNLITMYLFYELITLTSVPLIMHAMTKDAVMAGLKYLFYSIAGAFLALFGIFFIYTYGTTLTFTPGGILDFTKIAGHEGIVLFAVFCMLIGFGAKAGMFPLHAWLPTAHPIAPAPASAVFSGIITKSGVLAIIRTVYYLVGADFLRGTWVQYTWMGLAIITVLMGSMMAYKEPVLKKRLAYSTVSQVSYMLFGLSLLNTAGIIGAMSHIVYHSLIKSTLFLAAGAIIYKTGKTKVSQLNGIGKEMPVTIWCFALVSLALIGIPPTSGFVSKWYLAIGALEADIGILPWIGIIVLLISALLTAGYLLPVVLRGFFPGTDFSYDTLEAKEPSLWMLIPMLLLTLGAVILGMWTTGMLLFLTDIANSVL